MNEIFIVNGDCFTWDSLWPRIPEAEAGTVELGAWSPATAGTPQGGPLSPLLRQVEVLTAQGQSVGGGDPLDRRDGGELRDELLNGETFYTLQEAKVVIEGWRRHDNTLWTPPAASWMSAWSAVDATIYPACLWGDHALGHDEDPLLSAS